MVGRRWNLQRIWRLCGEWDAGALTTRLDHLHALLRRLNLERETILPYTSPDSKEQPMTLDKYLDLLDRQLYLEKVGPIGCFSRTDLACFKTVDDTRGDLR